MEARFCGSCGQALPAGVAPASTSPPSAPPSGRTPARTIIGVAPDALTSLPAAGSAPTDAPRTASTSNTILGLSPGFDPAHNVPSPIPSNTSNSPTAPDPQKPNAPPVQVASAHKTMIGMAMSPPSAVQPSNTPKPSPPAPVANAYKTMLGMPMDVPNTIGPAHRRSEPPPMLGGPAPGAPPEPAFQAPITTPSLASPSRATSTHRRTSPVLVVGLATILTLVAAIGVWVILAARKNTSESPLQAQVQSQPDGTLTMLVTIPGMPAGTSVRYGNQTQTLDAQGQARFRLNELSNRVGTIELPLEIIPLNGKPQRRIAQIVLAYRVEPDLSNLAADRPGLRLIFHVVPGSRLVVNGQPVTTDPSLGVGAATIDNVAPLPVDGPDSLSSPFDVRVTAPDGTTATGVYHLRVPRTPLLVERPSQGHITTTADRVVLHGRAPGARRITLNGSPVPLEGHTFTTVVPVPTVGQHIWTLVAYSTSGAPALARITVERIAPNDRRAIARFLGASPAGAQQISTGTIPPGTHVRVRGRVLGAPREYEGGQTFQLVVTESPCQQSRCLVWIDTEPGVTVTDGTVVQVIGTVTGRRQAVTASGERRSDVVIHAVGVWR